MAEKESSQVQQAGWIIDARGRRVPQLDPVMMHVLRRHGTLPPDVLKEIAQQVGLGITRGTRVAFWASIVGLACLAIALGICATRFAAGSMSTGRLFRSLVPYMALPVGLIGTWIALRKARHQQIGKAMLHRLRCPHCGYDIRALPVDPDDSATVCPECGCAWRLDADRDNGNQRDE